MSTRRFRKRADVIEAEQFSPDDRPWPKGVKEEVVRTGFTMLPPRTRHIFDGDYIVPIEAGDFVVTEADGRRHVVRASVFSATYEPVKENCRRCGHTCSAEPCPRCVLDTMEPGDELCVVCDAAERDGERFNGAAVVDAVQALLDAFNVGDDLDAHFRQLAALTRSLD